jgi:nicotinamide riboside kinase
MIHQSILYKPVINIFGSPNSGKSVLASYIFSQLKTKGCNCELVQEVAKDIVYEKSKYKIWNQPYVFGRQLDRMIRLVEDVDVIITDSPILLSYIYTPDCFSELKPLTEQAYSYFDNFAYILPVHEKYDSKGRIHKKADLQRISKEINELVFKNNPNDRILELKDHNLETNFQLIEKHSNLERFYA